MVSWIGDLLEHRQRRWATCKKIKSGHWQTKRQLPNTHPLIKNKTKQKQNFTSWWQKTVSLLFIWDFPSFSMENSPFQKMYRSWENWDVWGQSSYRGQYLRVSNSTFFTMLVWVWPMSSETQAILRWKCDFTDANHHSSVLIKMTLSLPWFKNSLTK